jgi:hypothetical protein
MSTDVLIRQRPAGDCELVYVLHIAQQMVPVK